MSLALIDQIESLKNDLTSQLEHAFGDASNLPSTAPYPLTLKQAAAKELAVFTAYVENHEEIAVHSHAYDQGLEGIPTGILFRLSEALRTGFRDALNDDTLPLAFSAVDSYCTAYAEGYADGRAAKIARDRASTSWLALSAELSVVLNSVLNPDELLSDAADLIRAFSDSSSVTIFLVDDSYEWSVVEANSTGRGQDNYPTGSRLSLSDKSPVSQCIATGAAQVLLIGDELPPAPERQYLSSVRSMMVLPLVSHGQTIGAVSFHREGGPAFDADDQMPMRLTLDQIAIAIENRRLYRDLARYADELERIVQERTQDVVRVQEFTDAILENSPDAILFLNTDASIQRANGAFHQLFGYQNDKLPNILLAELASPESKNLVNASIDSVVATGHVARFRMSAVHVNGTTFDVDAALAPSFDDGSLNGVICNMRDVTDLVHAEDRIKASLREKEVLLQEIHHRVKNNLQIVASLISLQTAQIADESASRALVESEARIRAMALIHERLYNSSDLSSVNSVDYIRDLVNHICKTYSSQAMAIQVTVDVANLSLDLDTAIPCGLIINELLSNAFRHAFPAQSTGEIAVAFRVNEQNQFVLVVRDNGVGFPQSLDPWASPTLGLRLVRGLVEQLNGTLDIQSKLGATAISIQFSSTTDTR